MRAQFDKLLLLGIIVLLIAFVLAVSFVAGPNTQQLLSFGIQGASGVIGALLLLVRGKDEKEKPSNEESNSGSATGGGVGAGVRESSGTGAAGG